MKTKSKKQLAEIRRRREADKQLQQHQDELERFGPNGVGAVACKGVIVFHWDGSKEQVR